MHVRTCVRAAAVLGIAASGLVVFGSGGGVPGVSQALAAEFYTRKRVNGQWITGIFPKGEVDGQLAGTRRTARPRVAYAKLPAEPEIVRVLPPPRAAELAADDVTASAASGGSSETRDGAGDRLGRLRDALLARAGEIVASVPTLPGMAVGLTGLDPRPALPSAAETPVAPAVAATPVAAAPVPSGLALSPKPVGPKAASQLEPAPGLAAPAASHAVAAAAATPARIVPLEPKSVSYDFERGIKTTVYESSVVREPFDAAAAKGFGAKLPAGPVR